MMSETSRKYQHHPVAFKRTLVEASFEPGVSMAALAREHGVNANQLWSWRKLYKEGRLGLNEVALVAAPAAATLLAVDLAGEAAPPAALKGTASCLEITVGDARLRATGAVNPELLKTAIAALRA